MADIKTVLRDVVIRLAKQEVNAKVRPLEKKLAELREACRLQKKMIVELQKNTPKNSGSINSEEKLKPASPEAMKNTKLFPALIVALRKRLDLSGIQFGKILGVGKHTVYKWESGKSKPMNEHKAKIIALRGIGKAKAKELLKG